MNRRDTTSIGHDVHTHVDRGECTIVSTRGMIVSDWRSHVHSPLIPELRRAVEEAAAIHGSNLVALSVHRLSPRFPLPEDFAANLGELRECFRAVNNSIKATAMVVEFGGLLGGTMRGAVGVITAFLPQARPLKVFDRRIDALRWLVPRVVDAPHAAQIDHYLFVANSLSEQQSRGVRQA